MQPSILAETADFIVLNKPPGLITYSDGRTAEPSLAEWLVNERSEQKGIGEAWVSPQGSSIDVAGLVHRLDRTTSGIMLAAKNDAAFKRLRDMLKRREIQKSYLALAYGRMQSSGRVVAEIERTNERPRKWRARPSMENDRRAAITNWRVIKDLEHEGESVSYLAIIPETGRTHQIRVHLASIGHPVVADHLYASEKPTLGFIRPMLHASRLAFDFDGPHEFSAPLPDDFPKP